MLCNLFKNSRLWVRQSYAGSGIYQGRNFSKKLDENSEIQDGMDIEGSMFSNSVNKVVTVNKMPQLAKKRHTKYANAAARNKQSVSTDLPSLMPAPRLIEDTELGVKYHRLQLHDPILNKLMTVVRSRKRHDKQAPIVIEGHRHIKDALDCELHMQTLIFSQKDELKKICGQVSAGVQIYKVPQHDLKVWSTLKTPPGLMALFGRPEVMPFAAADALPLTVICDNIREPNNLGSIIRTCAALPCQQVIVTRGCCDPWESKALRGGCGGHYRVPINDGLTWNELPSVFAQSHQNLCIYIAENNLEKLQQHNQQAIDYAHLSRVGQHNIVIIGGESHGVSDEAYNFLNSMDKEFGSCLNIPVAHGVDSLNVASALTLVTYELRKIILRNKRSEDP